MQQFAKLIESILALKFLAGFRTILGAVGMIGSGIGLMVTDPPEVVKGIALISAGVSAIGLRFKKPDPPAEPTMQLVDMVSRPPGHAPDLVHRPYPAPIGGKI